MTNASRTDNLLFAIVLMMGFAIAFFAKDVLLPIVLGVLLTMTLSPMMRAADRLGVPHVASAVVLIFGLAALVIAAALMLGGQISAWLDDLPRISTQLRIKLADLSNSVAAAQEASKQVEEIAKGGSSGVQRVVVDQPGLLTEAVGNMASFVTSLAVGTILCFFLLCSGDLFYIKLVQSFSRISDKKRALRIVYDIERRISRYLLAITVINAGLGLCVGSVLYALGLPYAFIWGAAAFALNYLPFLGGLIGAALVGAVSIVTFDSLGYALLAPSAYLFLTALEGQIITPTLLGRQLELNTVSVFLTVIFWGWLWGIPGALMAVPFLVLLKVICDNVEGLGVLGNFLGARETPLRPEPEENEPAAAA